MKIYCSRTYDLDYFINKDLWVLCKATVYQPVRDYYYCKILNHDGSTYTCDVIHNSNLLSRDNGKYTKEEQRQRSVQHNIDICEDSITMVLPVDVLTTAELFTEEFCFNQGL